MTFEEYALSFRETASKANYPDKYTDMALAYARKLFESGCPVVYDIVHFSRLVGYKPEYIKRAIMYPKGYYRDFQVKKKNGKFRQINEPLPNLKDIQKWILENILYTQKAHKIAKAYLPKKHLKDNARFHTKRAVVIAMDIKDFFPSIHQDDITRIFARMGYTDLLSSMFAKLTCLNNALPQGAPTSPYLSNLYMYDFDEALIRYCSDKNIIYTRYADDLTFSSKDGNIDIDALLGEVEQHLGEKHLQLNREKTKVMTPDERQIVTGVVVNERVHASIELKKEIRQSMFYIRKYGIASHKERIGSTRRNYERYLLGQINFVLSLEPQNKEFLSYRLIMQKQINPGYRRKLKRIKINDKVYQECGIEPLNNDWVEYLKLKENEQESYLGRQMAYGRDNSHSNTILFDREIGMQNSDISHTIIEGLVVDENGLSYNHFWNKLKQGKKTQYIDVTFQCFGTLFEQTVDKAYYPISEITSEELLGRIAVGANLYSDESQGILGEYNNQHPVG